MGQKNRHHFGHTQLNSRVGKTIPKEKFTKHHVPPKNPDPVPKPRILIKSQKHHEAYHLLFGAARSYGDACEILKRDWWQDEHGLITSPTLPVLDLKLI